MRYAVVRRAELAGEVLFPGDFVTDPDRATLLIQRGFIVPSVDGSPEPEAHEPSINELRARARELGLQPKGTKQELADAIAEAEVNAEQAPSTSPSVGEPAPDASGDEG